MKNKLKISQVDTPMFRWKDTEHSEEKQYWVDTYMYPDFIEFQKDVDKMVEKGVTHLFMYSISNMNGGELIVSEGDNSTSLILIRCKFAIIKDE